VDSPGSGLVLLRVINSVGGAPPTSLAPRQSPWVKEIASTSLGNELPTLMLWALSPASNSIRSKNGVSLQPIKDPDLYQFVTTGAYWSDAPFIQNYKTENGTRSLVRTWKSAEDFSKHAQ
jgi:hypothetical protein